MSGALENGDSMEMPELWTPEEYRFKERMAVGEAVLKWMGGMWEPEPGKAATFVIEATHTDDIRFFVADLMKDVSEIESKDFITRKGVALFLMHDNRLLGDISPLQAGVVDRHDLVLEAAHCFYDSERGFDPGLAAEVEETIQLARQFIA